MGEMVDSNIVVMTVIGLEVSSTGIVGFRMVCMALGLKVGGIITVGLTVLLNLLDITIGLSVGLSVVGLTVLGMIVGV